MPYVEIAEDRDDRVYIDTRFVDRFLIKQLPGAAYNGNRWHAPRTWATCVILRGLFGDQLEIGRHLLDWSWQEYKSRIEPAMKLRLALSIPDEFLDTPAAKAILAWRGTRQYDLFEFQEAGVLYLYTAISSGLLDPMGSGKTTQGIHLLRLLRNLNEDPYPALIVCPNTVKKIWANEFELWDPDINVTLVQGHIGQRRKLLAEPADVYIVNWESLKLHSRLAKYGSYALRGCRVCDKSLLNVHDDALRRLNDLQAQIKANQESEESEEPDEALDKELNEKLPVVEKAYKDAKRGSEHTTCERCPRELNEIHWQTIIADEAHRARDPRSKQTRALWSVSESTTRKPWMTGTAFDSNPGELWSPLHYMAPDEWPAKSRYLDLFTETKFNLWGGMEVLGLKPENRDAFFKIFDPRVRRLPKSIILPKLPPLVMLPPRIVEMSPKQRKAYKQMLDHLMAELDDGTLLLGNNPLSKTTRLMQFASAYAEIGDGGHVNMALPSNKIDFMSDTLEELDTEQVVFFAVAPRLIELASERLKKMNISHGCIVSEMTLDERDVAQKRFQAGDFKVILATTGVGGEGITLTASSILIRLQRSWKNIHNLQTVDRVHRIGSEKHDQVRIMDAISEDTIEVSQIPALEGKYGRLQEVMRDHDTIKMILRGELPDELKLTA